MSQLTVTSYYTRKTLKYGAILLASFFILKTSFRIAHTYWLKLHPPAPPPPNTAFGKLPAIKFPNEEGIKPNSFQLETIEGNLPKDMPSIGRVYFIPSLGGKFLALEKATELAQKLGFNSPPETVAEDVYRFRNLTNNTTLNINVLNGQFEYFYNYLGDQTLINQKNLPSESEAISLSKSFLERIGKLNDELRNGNYQVSYWKIVVDHLESAIAPSEANFIKISLSRKQTKDNYPILPPNPEEGLISFLISGIDIQDKKVIEVKFNYAPVDFEKFGTYPFKTVQQAYDELKSGKFFLASINKNNNLNNLIKIRKVYFGYFDSLTPARFLQPIFVFQGDNNFLGYVPAIPIEWSD